MIIPPVHGEFCRKDFFIYSSADEKYFDEFVPALSKSIQVNTAHQLHLHLFNPRDDQLDFCRNNNISFTYEFVPFESFEKASSRFQSDNLNQILKTQKLRIITAMEKAGDKSIQERLQKTYFTCARFIRLKNFIQSNQKFFAIDVDAIVRKNIPKLKGKDFYIYHISGENARFLAGGLYYHRQYGFFN